jgi:tRNA(Ile)-lysidine synthase
MIGRQDLAGDLLSRCGPPLAPQGATSRAPTGDARPVPLAVSGGPDSLALVVLVARAGLEAVAIHVDHGLRPGSAGEAELVREAARRFGLGFERRRVEVAPGPDLEARARRARYEVLPEGVLLAHTMDDRAETMLINLMRGAGLDGLTSMRPVGTSPAGRQLRRPLLGLRRLETRSLCDAEQLEPFADPSNDDPRFLRNRVRAELLPLIAKIAARDVVPILARQADLLAAEADLLDELAAPLDPTDARQLDAVPPPLARRALRRWLRSAAASPELHPPSAAEIDRVLEVVGRRARGCELVGGRFLRRRSGRLYLASAGQRCSSAETASQ